MKQIFSKKAPAAIGPYCHAVVHNDMVFCSGQLAFDPKTMELVGNNIDDQTTQVMKNIESVLSELNIGLDKIVKATIFLNNIEDFLGMNKIYEACLAGHKPARSTFEVGRLPKDALVEIECIAVL
ncbi:MAG: reactive intermediate/imine deaminase [Desulfobacula sp.]|nr:reactive intermediate/imine deaminase [Desulfobacula sp.]